MNEDMVREIVQDMVKRKPLPTVEAKTLEIDNPDRLLIVTVGNYKTPATKSDMNRVSEIVDGLLEDTGSKALVMPHLVTAKCLRSRDYKTIVQTMMRLIVQPELEKLKEKAEKDPLDYKTKFVIDRVIQPHFDDIESMSEERVEAAAQIIIEIIASN